MSAIPPTVPIASRQAESALPDAPAAPDEEPKPPSPRQQLGEPDSEKRQADRD